MLMKCNQGYVNNPVPRRSESFWHIAKKSLLLGIMLFCSLSFLAAQNDLKVSVNFKNEPVGSALREIERQTGLNFIYNADHLKDIPAVTYSGKDVPLSKFLNDIIGNRLNLKFENNNVIMSPNTRQENERINLVGIVKDEDNQPIMAVSVYLKGETKIGASTDENGMYNFSVAADKRNAIAIFSFIGYETVNIPVSELKMLKSVTLKSKTLELSDVVVTGIFKKTSENYTGAAVTISAKELMQNGNRNLIQSLSNIDPTINLIDNNLYGSNPNRLPELQIRGNSSVPNISELKDETRVGINTPLIVLDGFESSLKKMYDLNENEVESITILKDASATGIYGSRGANGVIVITTKAPTMGKLRVSYRGDATIETPDLTEYHVLNAKEKLALELRVGLYTNPRAEYQWPLSRYYSYLLGEVNRGVDTYWLSIPLRVGVGQKHNVRIEGGDKTFRYSASAQYNDLQGVMKESFRKTFNGTINLSYYLKNVKFTNSLMLGLGNSQESSYGTFSNYVSMNPYWAAYDENGNALKTMGNSGNSDYRQRWDFLPTSPLYNATLHSFDKDNTFDITNNFSLEWKPIRELILRARIGLYRSNTESDIYKPGDHTDFAKYSEADLFRKGSYNYGVGKSNKYDASLNASYNKTFGKHMIYAGLDLNLRESATVNYGFKAEGFNNEKFDFIAMAMQYAQSSKPTGSESKVRAIGLTSNINYTYANRYYVDFSYRTDGSSQFGSNKRFAPFWSAGIGWNLHQESFLKGKDKINFLKVRGSVGTTGSQTFNAYQSISTYRYFTDDRYFNWIGAQLMGLGNNDLQWQQKFNMNLGLEAKFFNSRLGFTLDLYSDKTTEMISSISSPAANGFTSYVENVGEMRNKGYELKVTAAIIRNTAKQIFWNVTIGAMHNDNKIISVSQALLDAQKSIEEAKVANPSILYKPGYSSNTLWVVPSAGIDPSNGKEIYIDRLGNPTYVWDARDIIGFGSTDPKLQGIISTMFKYKGFTLNTSFGYKIKGKSYNSTLINKVENADFKYNVDSRVYYDRWSKVGDVSAFKGLDVTSPTYKTSRFVQEENLFRCQNLTLQYEMKNPKLSRVVKIENILFTASTSDLFYWTSIKKERGLNYPYSHQFSFSVNITF